MGSSSSSYGIGQLQQGCYYEWMSLQAKHIADLKEALMNQRSNNENHQNLEELVGVIVNDFHKYAERRSRLSDRSCSSYFAPLWNSSLVNGLLWMGGCRPSSFIRVIYALCGSQTETQISQYLLKNDERGDGLMNEFTAAQLIKVNELHVEVIAKEDGITKKTAHLQEDVADMPVAVMAYTKDLMEVDVVVKDALDRHEESMGVLLAEADNLRLETLKKIVEILTPIQVVEFLLAGKRLQLSLHQWGRLREELRFGCPLADAATGGAGAEK